MYILCATYYSKKFTLTINSSQQPMSSVPLLYCFSAKETEGTEALGNTAQGHTANKWEKRKNFNILCRRPHTTQYCLLARIKDLKYFLWMK